MESVWLMVATVLYNMFLQCLQNLCIDKTRPEWKEDNLDLIKFNEETSQPLSHSTVFVCKLWKWLSV